MQQTTLQNPFNIIKLIKTVAEKLENSKLDPTQLKGIRRHVAKLSEYLNADENQVMIFSALFILDFLGTELNINNILNYIGLSSTQIDSVQADLDKLVEYKLINLKLLATTQTDTQAQSDVLYKINAKINTAILNNTIILTQNLYKPLNIFQFTKTIRELVDSLNSGFINQNQLLASTGKLEQANSELGVIRQLAEYDLRPIDRIILYYMFDVLISWRTGCSLNMSIKPLFRNSNNEFIEIESIIRGYSDLINQHFITVRKSEIIDDYYLELTPDTLLLFLVEDSKLICSNNQLLTNDRIQIKESYFNNN
jgi:hypothetical protein